MSKYTIYKKKEAYTLITADSLPRWISAVIPTTHVPELDGRCFGYCLNIEDKDVVYTGDTNTLKPFEPYLKEGSVLYTEVASSKSDVHICLEEWYDYLTELTDRGIEVYLMHVNDEDEIRQNIEGSSLKLAPIFQ